MNKMQKLGGLLRGDIGANCYGLTHSFKEKNLIISPYNKLFEQEMHLKVPLSSHGLKLSRSKTGSRFSALHFFVK
jgi:hypothetical protein